MSWINVRLQFEGFISVDKINSLGHSYIRSLGHNWTKFSDQFSDLTPEDPSGFLNWLPLALSPEAGKYCDVYGFPISFSPTSVHRLQINWARGRLTDWHEPAQDDNDMKLETNSDKFCVDLAFNPDITLELQGNREIDRLKIAWEYGFDLRDGKPVPLPNFETCDDKEFAFDDRIRQLANTKSIGDVNILCIKEIVYGFNATLPVSKFRPPIDDDLFTDVKLPR